MNGAGPVPPYFTMAGYRAILQRALDAGYRITSFRDFAPPSERPVLLLRHDLDHSVRSAARVAALEAEVGVRSTFFVQIACDFYNLLSPESRQILRDITRMGHEIGLHYEAARYMDERGKEHLRCDLTLLESIVEEPVVSASQHIPIATEHRLDLRPCIANEAYEPRFTAAAMSYISDSLMVWRDSHPHALLDDRRSFQLLTHPMKWTAEYASIDEALHGALREEIAVLEANYRRVAERYRWLLAERPRLDAAFRDRKQAGGLTNLPQ